MKHTSLASVITFGLIKSLPCYGINFFACVLIFYNLPPVVFLLLPNRSMRNLDCFLALVIFLLLPWVILLLILVWVQNISMDLLGDFSISSVFLLDVLLYYHENIFEDYRLKSFDYYCFKLKFDFQLLLFVY